MSNSSAPLSQEYEDFHVRDIQRLANDVEMQTIAESTHAQVYIVIDTNILLHFCALLQSFIEDVERWGLPIQVIVPGIVIDELDRQKGRRKDSTTALLARFASRWLLDRVKLRATVRGQAHKETMKRSMNWRVADPGEDSKSPRYNDTLILDCCLYYAAAYRSKVILFCHDNNLCTECQANNIPTITPENYWSSQDIARQVYDYMGYANAFYAEKNHFSTNCPEGYRGLEYVRGFESSKGASRTSDMDTDGMDVDEDLALQVPSHTLDVLHRDVVLYFTQLLREAAHKLDQQYLAEKQYSDSGSIHSRRRPPDADNILTSWSADQCISFIKTQTGDKTATTPKLSQFLAKDRTPRSGWRRGQDWSRSDWVFCFDALKAFGERLQYHPLLLSLEAARPHVDGVFTLKLRPTGM